MAGTRNIPLDPEQFISAFPAFYDAMMQYLESLAQGPDEPPVIIGMWADTATGKLRLAKTDGSAWVTLADLDAEYGGVLPLVGGTMQGPIDMNGFAITGLPGGSGDAPPTTSELLAYTLIDGSRAFTGWPSLPSSGTPPADDKPAPKGYVDSQAKAGGTFTGRVYSTFSPVGSNELVRLTDVISRIQNHGHTGGTDGARIGVEEIDATDDDIGDAVMADGADRTFVRRRCDETSSVLTLADTQNAIADALYDVSSVVAAVAQAVILRLEFQYVLDGSAAYMTVLTRKLVTGTQKSWAPFMSGSITGSPTLRFRHQQEITVPLDPDKKFRMQITRTGSVESAGWPNVKVQAIGRI